MIQEHELTTGPQSRELRKLLNRIEGIYLGNRTVKFVEPAQFAIKHGSDGLGCQIVLHPWTLSRVLLRIFERVMMHLSATSTKDTPIEPLLKFVSFIAAMDYDNFGIAASICAGRYVAAFSSTIPEPFRSLILPTFTEAASKEPLQDFDPTTTVTDDPETIAKWASKSSDEAAITIDQLAILLDSDRHTRGATTTRRLREKLERLGVEILDEPGIGKHITVTDFQKNERALRRHGNERSFS